MTDKYQKAAYALYCIWKIHKCEDPVQQDQFQESPYRKSFELFAQFYEKHRFPFGRYIICMVSLDAPPITWTSEAMYNEWLVRKQSIPIFNRAQAQAMHEDVSRKVEEIEQDKSLTAEQAVAALEKVERDFISLLRGVKPTNE